MGHAYKVMKSTRGAYDGCNELVLSPKDQRKLADKRRKETNLALQKAAIQSPFGKSTSPMATRTAKPGPKKPPSKDWPPLLSILKDGDTDKK